MQKPRRQLGADWEMCLCLHARRTDAPRSQRGLGISLFRCAGDIGGVAAPVLLGTIVDYSDCQTSLWALALSVGMSGIAMGLVGDAKRLR